jgi:nucleotide-binding universal stress UspA family protein
MTREARPVLVGYDGSELAKAAVRYAAELFPGRRAVVATVWEPGMAVAAVGPPDAFGIGTMPPDLETVEAVNRSQREHAVSVAAEGTDLARSLGLDAEPHVVPDEVDIADTLLDLARERSAAVVVVGTHGISGVRSRLLGSVTRTLIEHSDRPVLVTRGG